MFSTKHVPTSAIYVMCLSLCEPRKLYRTPNFFILVTNVNDPFYSTKLLAQTTMRNILGTKTLSEMLSEREHIAEITEKGMRHEIHVTVAKYDWFYSLGLLYLVYCNWYTVSYVYTSSRLHIIN